MDHLIGWCGFFGAWMLVAGPLFQATRELEEEEFEREAFIRAAKDVERPPPVSNWWWLLPPVHYVLARRRSGDFRQRIWQAMPAEQMAAFESFRDKADAWMAVAFGAFLIAVKETWELDEVYAWPQAVFWVLLPLMAFLCVGNTIARVRRRKRVNAARSATAPSE